MSRQRSLDKIKGYYFITDSVLSRSGILRDVHLAVKAGVSVVQYRNKISPSSVLYKEALAIRRVCKKTLFIVNDRLDIALAVDADGVHLGQDDIPVGIARKVLGKKKIIGASVDSLSRAESAVKAGADYLGVGPVFATSTKKDAAAPVGAALIRRISGRLDLPIAAIGGITIGNAPDVIAAGANAVCAISAVACSPDAVGAMRGFMRLFPGNDDES